MNKTRKPSETNLIGTSHDLPSSHHQNMKGKMTTVPLRKKMELPDPEQLQSLLTVNDENSEFQKKMETLRCRYKHAVKSELISFCYASSDPAGDAGLVPESSTRNREFVKTLMGVVEKDKEVADLAVGLVEDLDAMEKARTVYVSKRSRPQTEESAFQQLWENHKELRKQIANILKEERNEIYGEKDVSSDVNIIQKDSDSEGDEKDDDDSGEEGNDEGEWSDASIAESIMWEKESMASDIVPDTEEEKREKEIRRGLQKIMRRLGCDDAFTTESYQDNLKTIQRHFLALREDIKKLKE